MRGRLGAVRRRYLWTLYAATGLLLGLAGIAIRVNNALRYRTHLGFDANFNWEYIQALMQSWALPDPDAGWSTARPPLFYYASAAIGRAVAAPPFVHDSCTSLGRNARRVVR